MEYKKCACGCGKIIADATNAQKFYDGKHRRRYYYMRQKGIETSKETERQRKKTFAAERWRSMSWAELSLELARMHKSYGEVQTMYYNGTLPDDFGI